MHTLSRFRVPAQFAVNILHQSLSVFSERGLAIVSIVQQVVKFGQAAADVGPDGEIVLSVGKRKHQSEHVRSLAVTGLHQGEQVVKHTESVQRWQSLVFDCWDQLHEQLWGVARAVEADRARVHFDPVGLADATQGDTFLAGVQHKILCHLGRLF